MNEREQVVSFIRKQYENRFRVFDNLGTEKKIVGGQFPDIIFMQKEPPPNNNILFVLKVETNENLIDNVSEWKSLSSTPSVFYLVVPKNKLDEAKKLANATETKARFAWYEIENNKVKQVHYE